jgi:hypothetical protein
MRIVIVKITSYRSDEDRTKKTQELINLDRRIVRQE